MRDNFKDLSREELIDQIIFWRGKYELEKVESNWLDELADALREGEDGPDYPASELEAIEKEYNEYLVNSKLKL